jgi:hypothetical protein
MHGSYYFENGGKDRYIHISMYVFMCVCVHVYVCMHIEVFVMFFVKFMRCACELVEFVLVLKIGEICIMFVGFVFEFVKCVFEFIDFFF